METDLTKQDILELLDRQAREFQQRLLESDKSMDKNREEFHQRLIEADKRLKDFEDGLIKSRADFDKRLGEIVNDEKFVPKEWKVEY